MAEEIYRGHDCTKEAKVRTRTDKKTGKVTYYYRPLRLQQNRFVVDFGETVMLKLLHSHADCDDVCYHWKQMTGGGYLIEDFGPEVGFVFADNNKECENNAVVNVYSGQKRLDTAYISSTRIVTPGMAYEVVTGEIYAQEHSGSKILIGPGRWRLADEYIEASYKSRTYDCAGNFISWYRRFGIWWRGTGPPIDRLKETYGDRVGLVTDRRSAKMKKEICCPVALLQAAHEETLETW